MVEWAAGHNACYRDRNVTDARGREVGSQFEHYTFCPAGSEYEPEVERYYRVHEMQRTGFVFRGEGGEEEGEGEGEG